MDKHNNVGIMDIMLDSSKKKIISHALFGIKESGWLFPKFKHCLNNSDYSYHYQVKLCLRELWGRSEKTGKFWCF